jgi:ADP-heptose:LPS heptosyltransferase
MAPNVPTAARSPQSPRFPGEPAVDPRRVRRVAVIRPRFLGDLCLTMPVVDAVRAACPEARIAYVVEPESAPLLDGDPRIAEVITVPRAAGASDTLALVGKLRRFAPDVAFDLFCNPRTAIWTFASGARVRVGYPFKGWRSSMYTHHSRPRTLSATGFHLASLTAIGWPAPANVPRLHVSEARRAEAAAALAEMGVAPDATLVGFHPGARWETRRWAPERFVALAALMLEATPGAAALITGGPGEAELVQRIASSLDAKRVRAIVGWPVARFVALQSRCAAFVCGDTGPLHTSVASGAPTLGLISRNRPSMFFPYPESLGHRAHYARVECSPCHRDLCADLRCLHRLDVDGAWRLLRGMLEARAASGHDRDSAIHSPQGELERRSR